MPKSSTRREIPGRILFLGAMGRPLNQEAALYFCNKVLPTVLDRVPEAEFWVVGGNPPRQLVELSERNPALHVTGYVEDIWDSYRTAAVFVAPILAGGGIIVKILDAMACGVPVVTTSFGNEGIRATDGEALFVADDPDTFAERVIRLLRDPELRARMGESGRKFAEQHFRKDDILDGLENALMEAAGHRS